MNVASVQSPGVRVISERDICFGFNSRPYGRMLLGVLGVAWLLDFIGLAYLFIVQSDFAARNQVALDIVGQWLDVVVFALFLINVLAFLLWMYRTHQDLHRLIPNYPISPRSAVVKAAIPIYGVKGLSDIYKTMNDKITPDFELELWAWLVPGTYAAQLSTVFFDLGFPDWTYQLLTLSVTSVWLISTQIVHRTLAHRVGERLVTVSSASQVNDQAAANEEVITQGNQNTEGTAAEGVRPAGEPKKPKSLSSRLKVGLVVAVLGACVVSFLVLLLPTLTGVIKTGQELNLKDENYDHLVEALLVRLGPDDSVPNFWVEWSWFQPADQAVEIWLIITLESTTDCTTGPANPCELLADEIARIVLDEYGRINELTGLHIQVGQVDEDGYFLADGGLEKRLTVAKWRQELDTSALRWLPLWQALVAVGPDSVGSLNPVEQVIA